MKIYIVECSSGSYDDYRRWNHSIHTDPIIADEFKRKLLARIEHDKNIEQPFEPPEDWNDISEKKWTKYNDWQATVYNASEFNAAEVVEYETDKINEN